MPVLCLYGTRKSNPRVKSELCKQQYSVTHFDWSHLGHVIVLWQVQKILCYCTVFALIHFEFEGNFQVQVPRGLYLKGRFNERVFELPVWGAYIWRGLFSEFYGILNSRQDRSNGLPVAGQISALFEIPVGMCSKARVTHLIIKVPYNVLLGDTTNANNVSPKNSAVARLDVLGGG